MPRKPGWTLLRSMRVTPRSIAIGLSVAGTLALLTSCSGEGNGGRLVIGVVQVSSLSSLDEAREWFYNALAYSGFIRDVNVTFIERNAQRNIPTLSLIMLV